MMKSHNLRRILWAAAIFLSCLVLVTSTPDDDAEPEEPENVIRSGQIMGDKEHMQHHLKDRIKFDVENATEKELSFHFFQLHDTDHNNVLDGLELYHAIEHGMDVQYANIKDNAKFTDDQRKMRYQNLQRQASRTVDRIMIEDDQNQDGYLTYSEYATARMAPGMLSRAGKNRNKM